MVAFLVTGMAIVLSQQTIFMKTVALTAFREFLGGTLESSIQGRIVVYPLTHVTFSAYGEYWLSVEGSKGMGTEGAGDAGLVSMSSENDRDNALGLIYCEIAGVYEFSSVNDAVGSVWYK